jgi:hypothetical protein
MSFSSGNGSGAVANKYTAKQINMLDTIMLSLVIGLRLKDFGATVRIWPVLEVALNSINMECVGNRFLWVVKVVAVKVVTTQTRTPRFFLHQLGMFDIYWIVLQSQIIMTMTAYGVVDRHASILVL